MKFNHVSYPYHWYIPILNRGGGAFPFCKENLLSCIDITKTYLNYEGKLVADDKCGDDDRAIRDGAVYNFDGTSYVDLNSTYGLVDGDPFEFELDIFTNADVSTTQYVLSDYKVSSPPVGTVLRIATNKIQLGVIKDSINYRYVELPAMPNAFYKISGSISSTGDMSLTVNDQTTTIPFIDVGDIGSSRYSGLTFKLGTNGQASRDFAVCKIGSVRINSTSYYNANEESDNISFNSYSSVNGNITNAVLSTFHSFDKNFINYPANEEGFNEGLTCYTNGISYIDNTDAYGSWEFSLKKIATTIPFVIFISDSVNGGANTNGYTIASNATGQLILRRENVGSSVNLFATDAGYISDNIVYTIKIERAANGEFTVYIKGGIHGEEYILVGIAGGAGSNPVIDNTYTTSAYSVFDLDSGDTVYNFISNGIYRELHNATVGTGDSRDVVVPANKNNLEEDVLGASLHHVGRVKRSIEVIPSAGTILQEGFENGGALPAGWTSELVVGTKQWAFQAGGNGGNPPTAHTGDYNAYFFQGSGGPYEARLITPELELAGKGTITLKFWLAMIEWSPDQDQLRIEYRKSATDPWVQIFERTTEVPDWTQFSIELPDVTDTYQIAFKGFGDFGRGVCIDNIQIEGAIGDSYTYKFPDIPEYQLWNKLDTNVWGGAFAGTPDADKFTWSESELLGIGAVIQEPYSRQLFVKQAPDGPLTRILTYSQPINGECLIKTLKYVGGNPFPLAADLPVQL